MKLLSIIFILSLYFNCSSQTLSPILVLGDNIEISNLKFINPQNAQPLKLKASSNLIDILEEMPDTIQLIIPFKSGRTLLVDSVPSIYLYSHCIISASENYSASNNCIRIWYQWADMFDVQNLGSNCMSQMHTINLGADLNEYWVKTKDIRAGINYNVTSQIFIEKLKAHANATLLKQKRHIP